MSRRIRSLMSNHRSLSLAAVLLVGLDRGDGRLHADSPSEPNQPPGTPPGTDPWNATYNITVSLTRRRCRPGATTPSRSRSG